MGISAGINPRAGTGMGKKRPPRALAGTGAGKFFPRGDGDGKPFPDGEFPVAIPSRGHHRPLTPSRATPPPPPTSPTPMDRRSRCRGRRCRLTPMDTARGLARRHTPPLHFFLRDAAPVQMVSTSTGTFLPLDLASS
jgi:hypothetical protein